VAAPIDRVTIAQNPEKKKETMESKHPTLPEVQREAPQASTQVNNRIDQHIDDLVGVFTDPVIVWPSPWQDTMPEWIKPAVTVERLLMNMTALKGGEMTATDAEVLAYIYPLSLEHPMSTDSSEIYLYTSAKVIARHKKAEIPKDIKVETLKEYQMSLLRDLKRWLYEQRLKARQKTKRAQKAQARADVKAKAPMQLGLGV
jgi:hypothetical protein